MSRTSPLMIASLLALIGLVSLPIRPAAAGPAQLTQGSTRPAFATTRAVRSPALRAT
jgi:hypothetical protein